MANENFDIQKKREELLARIPYLDPIHSPNYQEVMDQMNTLVWEEIEDPMTTTPGCSTKTASGVYGIFATNAANGLAKEQLMMHEAGHCVLQHFKDNWYKDQQAARQIKAKWPKFKEHIEIEGNDEDELSKDFIHMIRNICQDLEINGKYWPDANNFEEVRQRISDAALTRVITYAGEKQLEKIESWMNEKPEEIHQYSKGQYPADFGFPNGLTWMGYLHLILTQPNEFMENLNKQVDEMQREQAEQQQEGQEGDGQQGQGQGSGNSSGQGQSSGSSQGGNQQQGNGNNSQQQDNPQDGLKEDQTSIFEHHGKDGEGQNGNQQGQNGNNGQQQGNNSQGGNGQQDPNGKPEDGNGNEKGGKSKLKNNGKPETGNGGSQDGSNGQGGKMKASVVKANAANGDKGNEIAQAIHQARENANAQQGGQPGQAIAASGSGGDDADDWSMPGDGESTNLVDATPTMKLDRKVIKFIEKNCIGKTVQRDRQDPLYNYNRGKTSGGVMRTRITTVEEYRPGNLVALIDVSGSVDIELVKALLSEVLKYKSKFGTKSRIILWDTHLVDDLPLKRSNLEAICCGGGTTIARGIKYAKDKYLKSEQDKLCVISDFEDNLNDWADELAGIKGDTFAVCWGGFDGSEYLKRSARGAKAEAAAAKMKVINVR